MKIKSTFKRIKGVKWAYFQKPRKREIKMNEYMKIAKETYPSFKCAEKKSTFKFLFNSTF